MKSSFLTRKLLNDGTLEEGSGPEALSGLGLVGFDRGDFCYIIHCTVHTPTLQPNIIHQYHTLTFDRGDICYIIPNLQHQLYCANYCGTPARSHQTFLYHTIRVGDKMHQYYVSRLVVLDREEGLVDNRKRAELYYWQRRRGQARGHFDPGCQVYSSQSCPCLPLHWVFQQRFALCWLWIG